tara:strand:+ start:10837 stop:11337 length:501 start_codon:yes stop_codon:yes gene_type:complete
MYTLGNIATNIYSSEFDDEPTEPKKEAKIQAISGWLDANLGQFNNLCYSSFGTGDSTFALEEESILTQLYLRDWYVRQARVILAQGATGALDWSRLSEGDTTIVRTNRIDLSRTYRSLSKDSSEELTQLIYSYNSFQAQPRQTAGFDGGFVSGSGSYFRYPYYPPY